MMALGGVAAVGAGAAVASAASAGAVISAVLGGLATVAGVVATIASANQEAETQELAALDAVQEQSFESLQGIERRSSLKKAAAQAIAEQDVAYAGSGVDLSFGTAAQARKEAYREVDTGITTDSGTQMSRQARLSERAANYKNMAKRTKQIGIIKGVAQGISGLAGIASAFG
ncbi:MAG: hypothetical protein KF723_22930 [Rhizobiaceae bacterium]|nr:hypothetical protein [Rhizobiaceae bacterium]